MPVRKFRDCDFDWIAEVDRIGRILVGIHEASDALNEVIDITERTGLIAVAINSDRFVA